MWQIVELRSNYIYVVTRLTTRGRWYGLYPLGVVGTGLGYCLSGIEWQSRPDTHGGQSPEYLEYADDFKNGYSGP